MSLVYDNEKFLEFRALAVTQVDDLKIGQKYYRNYGGEFVLVNLITTREMRKISDKSLDIQRDGYEDYDDTEIAYAVSIDGDYEIFHSLHDNNFFESYNPWLFFDNEELRNRCKEELKISYERNFDDYNYFDDFYSDFERSEK